jgi:hemerythrin-like domain-containing protein
VNPIQLLGSEHRIIEQVLNCLEKMAERCRSEGRLGKESARSAIEFLRNFADHCHHGKEEDLLFGVLQGKEFSGSASAIELLSGEHEDGRAHLRSMSDAVDAASEGDADALRQFADHSISYVRMLREHIHKEDDCLFPLAVEAMSSEEQEELSIAFDKFDHTEFDEGFRDKYVRIANQLAYQFEVDLTAIEDTGIHGPCRCWLYSELAERSSRIEKQNQAIVHDLEMARQVQRSLIPSDISNIQGLEVAFSYEPAAQVGGDIMDIIQLDDRKVLLFLGDAMGHGVQAALVMCVAKTAMRSAVVSGGDPAAILAGVNQVICSLLSDHFITAACCLIDGKHSRAELSLAGHAGPLRYRAETGDVAAEGDAGLPLGITEDAEYHAVSMELDESDLLLFSTDGVIEAFSPNGDQYGFERLKNQLILLSGHHPRDLVQSIRHDLEVHCKGHTTSDDVSLLAVRTTAVAPGTGEPDRDDSLVA